MINIERFLDYVIRKHEGQKRDEGTAYVTHPISVAMILAKEGYSDEITLAALGHDLIEDTDATYEEIVGLTSKEIADAILALSKPKGRVDYDKYYNRVMINEMARPVKVADRIHNLSTMTSGGWSEKRQQKYLDKTKKYIFPLAKHGSAAKLYGKLHDIYNNIASIGEISETTGTAITENDWHAMCPNCEDILDFKGFFDPDDVNVCPRCNAEFKVVRVYFKDDGYMGR